MNVMRLESEADDGSLLSEQAARDAAEIENAELRDRLRDATKEAAELRIELSRYRERLALAQWRTKVATNSRSSRIAAQLRRLRKPWRLPWVIIESARIALRPPLDIPPPAGSTLGAASAGSRSRVMPDLSPAVFPPARPRRPDLRVATILDEFSQLAFQHEFTVVPLPRRDWRAVLEREQPAFLFVESAWHGNRDEWQYVFTGEVAPKPDFVELIEYCRAHGIATVFWNKEDPLEYDLFLRTAKYFDWIFTVDENCVERYRRDLGHDQVEVLPFAVQPKVHNPIGGFGRRTENVAFAGTYYSGKYPERQQQMDDLLTPAIDLGLHIFSRFESTSKYQFPDVFKQCVVGSVDYARMLTAYRRYKVFLNVNSVTDSRTMFSRRVLELLACATPVVSGPSPGMAALLGPEVVAESTDQETTRLQLRALLTSPELRDRRAVVGLRAVMNGNTYSDRVDRLLATLRLSSAQPSRTISIVAPTNRVGSFRDILMNVGAQTHRDLELVIGLHGIDEDDRQIVAEARSHGIDNIQVIRLSAELSLGQVLNKLVEASSGAYVAKMDDDDLYGPNYLIDQVAAFEYADADVVGKWSRFILMEDIPCLGVLFPGKEHCYTSLVAGGTLLVRRQVFDTVRFADRSVGEDTQFLRDCAANGIQVYSTDRFNYVYIRTGDEQSHTYRPHRLKHLANTRIVAFDRSTRHAFV